MKKRNELFAHHWESRIRPVTVGSRNCSRHLLFPFFILFIPLLSGCTLVDATNRFSQSNRPAIVADVADEPRGTLKLPHTLGWGGVETADPVTDTPFDFISMLVHAGLVRFDANNQLASNLAERWETNADGTVWTFYLQEGVLFHNGELMTAQDVKYSFERILALGSDSPLAAILSSLERVEAEDDLTVHFHLSQTEVDFPLLLTDRRMKILSEGADPAIGAGPFMIDKFDPKNITYLNAFDGYWEGVPKLAHIEIIAIPELESQIAALDDGAVHFADQLRPEDLALFDGREGFDVQTIRTGDWRGIVFRTDMAPFDDVRVRRAARLVVDRTEMIHLVADGRVGADVACDTPIWSGDQYYFEQECAPDIVEARRLLAEAGFDEENPLEFTITTSDIDAYWQSMAEVYQFQAAKAGIVVQIEEAPSEGYWSDVWLIEPVVSTSWLERPAAQILSEAFRSGANWNETYWANPEFDALLAEASSTLEFEERRQHYIALQEMIQDEGGALIPFHINKGRVISSDLKGMPPINRFAIPWHEVYLESEKP